MSADEHVRDLLCRALAWSDAHVSFDDAVKDLDSALRGVRPEGLPHSAWELLEHLRLAQSDILDFCVNAGYEERQWPDDYWPATPAPASDDAWEKSIETYRADRAALQELAANRAIDLNATIPHGSGQTYARELVVVIDHAAYHVGELVLVRQILGAWHH